MTPKEIGAAIKEQRQKKNCTQMLLAGRMKKSRYTVERAEAYTDSVTIKKLIEVLEELDMEILVRVKSPDKNQKCTESARNQ